MFLIFVNHSVSNSKIACLVFMKENKLLSRGLLEVVSDKDHIRKNTARAFT